MPSASLSALCAHFFEIEGMEGATVHTDPQGLGSCHFIWHGRSIVLCHSTRHRPAHVFVTMSFGVFTSGLPSSLAQAALSANYWLPQEFEMSIGWDARACELIFRAGISLSDLDGQALGGLLRSFVDQTGALHEQWKRKGWLEGGF